MYNGINFTTRKNGSNLREPPLNRKTLMAKWLSNYLSSKEWIVLHVINSCRRGYGWPFVAKSNNVYLYAIIYIDSTSTQHIFIQRLYWFNFNTGYFHSTTLFIQLQHVLFLCKTNIYSTSTPKVMFYETNIYIQLQQKTYFHWAKHIYSTL